VEEVLNCKVDTTPTDLEIDEIGWKRC